MCGSPSGHSGVFSQAQHPSSGRPPIGATSEPTERDDDCKISKFVCRSTRELEVVSDESDEELQPFGCTSEEIETWFLLANFPSDVLITPTDVFISYSKQSPPVPDLGKIRYIGIPINVTDDHFMVVCVNLQARWYAKMGMEGIPPRIAEWLNRFCEFDTFTDKSPKVRLQLEEECGGMVVVYTDLLFRQKISVDVPLESTTFYEQVKQTMERWRRSRSFSEVQRQIALRKMVTGRRRPGRPPIQTYPPRPLSSYEERCRDNVERNNAVLKELGLDSSILSNVGYAAQEKQQKMRGRKRGSRKSEIPGEPTRRSKRVASNPEDTSAAIKKLDPPSAFVIANPTRLSPATPATSDEGEDEGDDEGDFEGDDEGDETDYRPVESEFSEEPPAKNPPPNNSPALVHFPAITS